jgi:hopanoid biosynthesis associated protein HpnK
MKSLIVNADDFGWTAGVNQGIADAHRDGIVTSASLLANGRAFALAVELARSMPRLGIGVHLNLSDGRPIAPSELISTLLNKAGEFDAGPENLLLRMAKGTLALQHVEQEWTAQIEKVREAGIQPTHVDGHKHVHMLPGLFEIALRLAKRYGIGAVRVSHETSSLRAALRSAEAFRATVVLKQGVQARALKLLVPDARAKALRAGVSTAEYFCGIAHTGELTKQGLARLLRNLPEGITELMCHPGYMDEDLANASTRLQGSRHIEVNIFTDPEIRNLVASQGIRLIDYGFVASEA